MATKKEPETVRLVAPNGAAVSVSAKKAERLLADSSWSRADAAPEPEGYAAMKVADLKAEIERRNDGRDEDALLPVDGKKAELVAVLEADDDDDNQ